MATKKSPASISFVLDPRKETLEAIMGAAYLMIDRAYAALDGDKKKSLKVTLTPKARGAAALKSLKADFLAELASQKLRWAIAKNNQPVREFVAENALSLSEEFAKRAAAPEPAAEVLTDDQRSEIERLIAEVETEIQQMNKAPKPEQKETALSWEATRDSEKGAA
jgi:His-Xaa-Ser system protein HxsD